MGDIERPARAVIRSARDIDRLSRRPGRHAVEGFPGLYLQVGASAGRSWILRYSFAGKRQDLGLGSAPMITLSAAKSAVQEARRQIMNGTDPLAARRAGRRAARAEAERAVRTFDFAVDRYVADHEAAWKGTAAGVRWKAPLLRHASPAIGSKAVDTITTEDILQVLRPIWAAHNPLAGRVRLRIELVLEAARVAGWREGSNPAAWRSNLRFLLPRPSAVHTVENRAALKIDKVPATMARLAQAKGMAALAVRFVFLTAGRPGEIAGARWPEIDGATWTIPAARMKTGRIHRVPLSTAALAVLAEARAKGKASACSPGDLVFPGPKAGQGLSKTALMAALRRATGDLSTVHGARTSFRGWCSTSGVDAEVAEIALSHAIGTPTRRAYDRDDLLEIRRDAMERWAQFACGEIAAAMTSTSTSEDAGRDESCRAATLMPGKKTKSGKSMKSAKPARIAIPYIGHLDDGREHGVGRPLVEALATVRGLKRRQRLNRLGAPLALTQDQWRAFCAGADLPDDLMDELEVRLLIVALELGVDTYAADWREVTDLRLTVRLLAGAGTGLRRFPGWLLEGQVAEPLHIVLPSGRRTRFSKWQLDEAELRRDTRAAGMSLDDALLPLCAQIAGGDEAAAKGLVPMLVEALRNRKRGRTLGR